MQSWPYKLDEADSRYVTVKGGFTFTKDGTKFTEVKNTDGKGNSMLLGDFPDGKGGRKYDVMSFDNWCVNANNATAIVACTKAYKEGSKARAEAKGAECKAAAVTLKGAGLAPAEVSAILAQRGYAKEHVAEAVK